MNRVTTVIIVLILASALAEAAPPLKVVKHKPMKVKCKDKYSPCYHKDLYCPAACPRDCNVDCNKCEAVCTPVPPLPPPPPKVVKPKQVKCKDKKLNPSCYNKKLTCPATCPRTCNVDCVTCQPVCGAVYTPPPPPTTPSPPQSPPQSPPPTTPVEPPSPGHKQVRCTNRNYPSCFLRQFTCPPSCPQSCDVDCSTCSPVCNCNKPGAVCQDPRFIGADGITFYFHGKKDRDFCLVTDSNLHINAHFIGKRNVNMGRDFTWVQSLGILFDNHKLYIGALKTGTWNDAMDRLALSFDGQPITLPEVEGASWQSESGNVTITRFRATNAVELVSKGKFKIKAVAVPITEKESLIHQYGITQEDCFAHLDLSFKFYSLSGEVNGVLGRTYATNYVSRVKMGVDMPVLGGEKEFSSSDLFSTNCAVARFTGNGNGNYTDGIQLPDLNCATGTGPGVVCKR
ncbi:hypothetical protein Cgig2_022952 [Carnegiea gigantea]|uniref:Root cap n=1 Tax=Carnegiea gigantea TaxID=171969 RepID=A0A9Q1KCU8_9CARY|nr:hypothetical protein Cgig2_022952 [Carnegiea gigantea]